MKVALYARVSKDENEKDYVTVIRIIHRANNYAEAELLETKISNRLKTINYVLASYKTDVVKEEKR